MKLAGKLLLAFALVLGTWAIVEYSKISDVVFSETILTTYLHNTRDPEFAMRERELNHDTDVRLFYNAMRFVALFALVSSAIILTTVKK